MIFLPPIVFRPSDTWHHHRDLSPDTVLPSGAVDPRGLLSRRSSQQPCILLPAPSDSNSYLCLSLLPGCFPRTADTLPRHFCLELSSLPLQETLLWIPWWSSGYDSVLPHYRGTGLFPGPGTKIPHVTESASEVAQLCPTLCDPWTVARQAPLSMGSSRQEYWSGLPFPTPGYLPDPGIEPRSSTSPALAVRFFTTSATMHFLQCPLKHH